MRSLFHHFIIFQKIHKMLMLKEQKVVAERQHRIVNTLASFYCAACNKIQAFCTIYLTHFKTIFPFYFLYPLKWVKVLLLLTGKSCN